MNQQKIVAGNLVDSKRVPFSLMEDMVKLNVYARRLNVKTKTLLKSNITQG